MELGPIPDKLAVALFFNRNDNQPRQALLSWDDLVERFKDHREQSDKDGQLWSPTLYRPESKRLLSNVVMVSAAVMDFDNSADWATVKDKLDAVAYIAHTSWQHTPEKPRFRVIIPFTEPVFADKWADAWLRVFTYFGGDKQDSDATRMYYMPSHPVDGNYWTECQAGQALDVWSLPYVEPPAAESRKFEDDEIWSGISEGARNVTLFKLAASLCAKGMSPAITRIVVGEAALRCTPPYPAEDSQSEGPGYLSIIERVYKAYEANDVKALREAEAAITAIGGVAAPVPQVDPFRMLSLRDLLDELDNRVFPGFLVSGVWPSDAYGVIAGQEKLGKSWLILDMAVSVASGTNWLNHPKLECPRPGPVLLFLGEGGDRKMGRRLKAVAKFKKVNPRDLPIHMVFKVPQMTKEDQLAIARQKILDTKPVLVILDPLYLAAAGADGKDLFAMGAILSPAQALIENLGYPCALVVTHHTKKSGDDSGFRRMTGVGPAAWGRVLITADSSDMPLDGAGEDESHKRIILDIVGDEIGDRVIAFRRQIWSDDINDINSEMWYFTAETEVARDLNEGERRVLAALVANTGKNVTAEGVTAYVNQDGGKKNDYTSQGIKNILDKLVGQGLIRPAQPVGRANTWTNAMTIDPSRFV